VSAESYNYLWDGSSEGWVLLCTNPDDAGEDPRYLIYNQLKKRALMIFDNSDYALAKSRMLSAGVRIVSAIEDESTNRLGSSLSAAGELPGVHKLSNYPTPGSR
jgi:hypothetical protein